MEISTTLVLIIRTSNFSTESSDFCPDLQEAFVAAKLAFREHKMKVRSNLAVTHIGPDTLEEAVQDYINRNTDLYDLPSIVSVSL